LRTSFLTGLLPGMPTFLAGWEEAIKDSELPYREAKASIVNLRQCPLFHDEPSDSTFSITTGMVAFIERLYFLHGNVLPSLI